jgi:hypothetical protein
MGQRGLLIAFSLLAIGLGADDLRTGRGSRVFGYGWRNTPLGDLHYTGPLATLEGLAFIGGGIYGLVRGIRNDVDAAD